jgi:beta-lactamase superfamily II metal-dependent hydrolase
VRVILFDVDHGFCAFIQTPTGHTILIDCGKGPSFSPTEYLLRNGTCARLTKLIISHPHDDHIEDFPRVSSRLNPAILLAQSLNWDLIKESSSGTSTHTSLDAYVAGKDAKFTGGWGPDPNYGMLLQSFWIEPNRAQQISASINSAVNNCSIVTVASFRGTKYAPKFVFGGDMEEAGWNELLATRPDFRTADSGTWFNFVSHHGHSSGFSAKLYDAMGKPSLNLISVRHNDESRDGRYSADDFATGWTIGGEQRKMLSTTCDGTIFIDVDSEGLPNVHTHYLPDNLEQPKSAAGVKLPDVMRRIGF